MSRLITRRRFQLAAAFLLGSLLVLSCQPAQPAATPRPAEKAVAATTAAATPAKPAEKAAERPIRGGTLRALLSRDPDSLDPHPITYESVNQQIYDQLIAPDSNSDVTKEGLFKDWTIAPDGKSITFKVQEAVKFHDGTDLDAAAVKFNIERLQDPATKSPYRTNYDGVDAVDVVDAATVRFRLSRPDPLLIPKMTTPGGQMVSPAAVKKLGQEFGRNPVGSGPFQFAEWAPGDHITLKRFAGYWGKDKDGNQLPYLDQVVWKIITDSSTAVANLRTGQIDLYAAGSGGSVPPEQLALIKGDPNLAYSIRGAANVSGIYLNTARSPFNNKALRQAVALAVNREAVAAFYGEGAAAYASIFHPMNWGADPKVGVYPARDLAKAKAKMAEAGYPSGGLKVKMLISSSTAGVRVAEITKANLAEIGVEAEIEVVASSVWLSRAATAASAGGGDYQISTGALGIGLSDPGHIFGLMFHSKASRNYWGPYTNPQVDQLLDKAGSIYDQKERTALYQEAAKLIVDDMPYVTTHLPNHIAARSKKVQNFVQQSDNNMPRLKGVWLAP